MRKAFFFFALASFCRLSGQQDSTLVYDNSPLRRKEISENFLQKYLDDKAYHYDIAKKEPAGGMIYCHGWAIF